MKLIKRTDDTGGIELNPNLLNDINQDSTYEGSERYYSFGMVIYDTGCDLNAFYSCPIVSNYAYIIHDKDDTDPHIHFLFTTSQNHSCKNIVKKFREIAQPTQNVFCRPIRVSEFKAYKYLTHTTEKCIIEGKTQYDESLIVTNDESRWVAVVRYDLTPTDLFDDLVSENFDLEYMCKKYGRDFMIHYKTYKEIRSDYFSSRLLAENLKIKDKICEIMKGD